MYSGITLINVYIQIIAGRTDLEIMRDLKLSMAYIMYVRKLGKDGFFNYLEACSSKLKERIKRLGTERASIDIFIANNK